MRSLKSVPCPSSFRQSRPETIPKNVLERLVYAVLHPKIVGKLWIVLKKNSIDFWRRTDSTDRCYWPQMFNKIEPTIETSSSAPKKERVDLCWKKHASVFRNVKRIPSLITFQRVLTINEEYYSSLTCKTNLIINNYNREKWPGLQSNFFFSSG